MTDQQTIVRCKDCKHWEEMLTIQVLVLPKT